MEDEFGKGMLGSNLIEEHDSGPVGIASSLVIEHRSRPTLKSNQPSQRITDFDPF